VFRILRGGGRSAPLAVLQFPCRPSTSTAHTRTPGAAVVHCRALPPAAAAEGPQDTAALHVSQLQLALGPHTVSMALQLASSILAVVPSPSPSAPSAPAPAAQAPPPPQPGSMRVQLRVSCLAASLVVQEKAPSKGPREISTRGLLEILVRVCAWVFWVLLSGCCSKGNGGGLLAFARGGGP
jgi:hypothetical protein